VQKIAGSTLVRASTPYLNPLSLPPSLSETIDLAPPVLGRYRISQGFNGEFSHNKLSNRYALDIALPIGTPLYATRDGVVMAAVDNHVGGGLQAKYRGKANHLRLRHADGTMTLYAHLQTGSLRVKEGDKVKTGQRVAASGHTGYSSGPHLHLALQVDNQGRRESVPFTLQGSYPVAGRWLLADEWGAE
jgi:murein DD-endopeptidase MepM/ murein hydrolase activator NlpD